MSDEDAKLVRSASSGDRESFDRLVDRYQRQAVAVAVRLLGNMDDGLEVAQDAFVKAYQALHQLKEPGRFGPWLMRIVTNQALNFRRSRSRRMGMIVSLTGKAGDESTDRLDQMAGKEPSAPEQIAAKELAVRLERAIEELPENLRTVLLLFAVEKLPQKEIAEMVGCSVQTVKWSVFEARRQLRRKLEKEL